MTTELISDLIGGLGLGSVVTAITKHLISRRAATTDRPYAEKREAYLGLLNGLHQAAVHPSDENSKHYALWQTRCELFGSRDVAKYAQQIVDTNDAPREQRNAAFRALLDAMKADL
jgi:hypothetical protein